VTRNVVEIESPDPPRMAKAGGAWAFIGPVKISRTAVRERGDPGAWVQGMTLGPRVREGDGASFKRRWALQIYYGQPCPFASMTINGPVPPTHAPRR
jgi:hypothetical protein